MSQSAIYEGHIRHRRFAVRNHEFRYRLAMAYVDLDELPELLGGRLAEIAPGARPLPPQRLPRRPEDPPRRGRASEGGSTSWATGPTGPIRLLTNLRSFGRCFNPVSFYYCFAPDGDQPRGDGRRGHEHAVGRAPRLRRRRPHAASSTRRCTSRRSWPWASATPGARPRPSETLSVHIESSEDGRRAFDATLSLKRKPFTRRTLARQPGSALRTLALIYAHAVALKLKGVPVQPHPVR